MSFRQSTRNETLSSALARMPVKGIRGAGDRRCFMERRGDGVPIIIRETFKLCGKYPEYQVIDGSEVLLVIPAAFHGSSPASVVVSVGSRGRPLAGADLLLLFPNKTWVRAATDHDGEATVELHTTHLPMTAFVAAPGHAAYLEKNWTPNERSLVVNMRPLSDGGSVVFPEGTGQLPGLNTSLMPVRDSSDRTCLYAWNIAINDGDEQPVYFAPGEKLKLTDADGTELSVRIVDIAGRSALVEYSGLRQTHH